jgi:hypothetical protein
MPVGQPPVFDVSALQVRVISPFSFLVSVNVSLLLAIAWTT